METRAMTKRRITRKRLAQGRKIFASLPLPMQKLVVAPVLVKFMEAHLASLGISTWGFHQERLILTRGYHTFTCDDDDFLKKLLRIIKYSQIHIALYRFCPKSTVGLKAIKRKIDKLGVDGDLIHASEHDQVVLCREDRCFSETGIEWLGNICFGDRPDKSEDLLPDLEPFFHWMKDDKRPF